MVPNGLTNVLEVSGGYYHSLALKSDGTVLAWGAGTNDTGATPLWGQAIVPVGLSNVTAVAAGAFHSLALKSDGTLAAWGAGQSNTGISPQFGQAIVLAGLSGVVAIAAGGSHCLALKADGTVTAWGAGVTNTGSPPQAGQALVPAALSNVVALAAGGYHSLALMADGTVTAWGDNSYGQTNVPAGLTNVVSIAAGRYNSMALTSDGTVVDWGDHTYGQTPIPAALTNVIAIADGGFHLLALQGGGSPRVVTQPLSRQVWAGASVTLTVTAVGVQPLSCQWFFDQTNLLAGATSGTLTLVNVQPANVGAYSAVITNALGSVTSASAVLSLLVPPGILSMPSCPAAGVFQVNVTGLPGSNYVMEAATNLSDWFPVQTNTSPFTFTDTNAAHFPFRFYRAHQQP
jgi:hypothetical protein